MKQTARRFRLGGSFGNGAGGAEGFFKQWWVVIMWSALFAMGLYVFHEQRRFSEDMKQDATFVRGSDETISTLPTSVGGSGITRRDTVSSVYRSENADNGKNLGISQGGTASTTQPCSRPDPLSPFRPSQVSLHPKWKLWTEFKSDVERRDALLSVKPYLQKYGKLIMRKGRGGHIKHGKCKVIEFGHGHFLCGPKPSNNTQCNFLSFGINDDPSWDIQVATQWNCRGYAGDPTVEHNSKLHPLVTFHNMAATLISENEERVINKGGEEEWWETSMPALRAFLKMDHITVIKLDCEGCEVALARDILREDPNFLQHVDQISIETHVTRTWINSTEAVYYFGLSFALLEEAGFKMEYSTVFGCSKRHEITGCVPELQEFGFPCGYDPWPGRPNVVLGRSCHDFLWKRYPSETASATTTKK